MDALENDYLAFLRTHNVEPNVLGITEDMLRQQLPQLDLTSFNITKEQLLNVFAELRPVFNNVYKHFAKAIEARIDATPSLRIRFKHDIYPGDFPTYSFNAVAVRVEHGYLALVHRGIGLFASVYVTFVNGLQADKERYSRLLAELVMKFLMGEDISRWHSGEQCFGLGSMWLDMLCPQFALAHEYGHILAGHLDKNSGRSNTISTPAGDIETVAESWEDELEADRTAIVLTGGPALHGTSLAPLVMFAIEGVVHGIYKQFFESDKDKFFSYTHPDPALRIRNIEEMTGRRADPIVDKIRESEKLIASRIEQLVRRAV